MNKRLIEYVDGLNLDNEQKEYLKLLIKEDMEAVLLNIADYVNALERGLDQKVVPAAKVSQELPRKKDPAAGVSVQAVAPAAGSTSKIDIEIDHLDEVLDYGDGVHDKAEETYNKVILSLKKNDRWLSKLIVKVQKSQDEIKVKFIELLEKAKIDLRAIRAKMENWWKEFEAKKEQADISLGAQVASVGEAINNNKSELQDNIVQFIEKLCVQYREKIDNMSKSFSNSLDSAAKQIDGLTDNTSEKMREVINEREQKKLMEKIMAGKK